MVIYQEVKNPFVWAETLRTMISVRGFIYKEVKRSLTLNLYSLHPLYCIGAKARRSMTMTMTMTGTGGLGQ